MVKQKNSGLKYRKIDLHVHTPASSDYLNKASTSPEDIVNRAIEEGLDAIAITDHNTGEYIDKIKEAAKNKLIIFPGVEISVGGGGNGSIHVIAIFDPTCTTKKVENLLGYLSIDSEKYGKEDAFSSEDISSVIEKIHIRGGLPILAHVNSSHGAMRDLKGIHRSKLIQKKELIAVEATDSNNEDKKENGKRVIDLLDGSDPSYKRKLAVYQSSDSHSLEQIGSDYTYFKLDEISLEGLRQCFFDPDVRIKQKEDFEKHGFPRITYLNIINGFLKDQTITFHEGLNSIIGGKGVGKSLIIEFLRFGLDQCSEDGTILKDHNSKIEKKLGLFGEVIVNFELENGEQYQIKRKYDGQTNPLECINLQSQEPYSGEISQIFPVLCYSQNEIIRIADDEDSQLRLIDTFIDSSDYSSQINSLNNKLSENDKELSGAISAISEVAGIKIDLDGVNERLKNIDSTLKNKLYDEIKIWENNHDLLKNHISFHENLVSKIQDYVDEIKNECTLPKLSGKEIDQKLKDLCESVSAKSTEYTLSDLKKLLDKIQKNQGRIQSKYDQWLPRFNKKRQEYEKMIQESGGNKAQLEKERRVLKERAETLFLEYEKYSTKLSKKEELLMNRNELLDRLDEIYYNFYITRNNFFKVLNSQSKEKLNLSLTHKSNSSDFKKELLELKKGSKIRESDIEKVSEKISPRKFIDYLILNNYLSLANDAEIAEPNSQKLVEYLNSKDNLEDILSLQYRTYLKDIPSIEFKKDDGNYYPLSELSVGQKCMALLIIALSEGTKPIIIDQPEDSLDNPSVYEDVVSKLRYGKDLRQFILTTHNSNVGVASDSDNFIVLKATANSGKIECSGAIDRTNIRSEIINHLEGGDEPYGIKKKKYNVN